MVMDVGDQISSFSQPVLLFAPSSNLDFTSMAVNKGLLPSLMDPTPDIGTPVLFRAGDVGHTVDDVVAFAMFAGILDDMVAETLALAAAEDRADAIGFEPDDAILQSASEAFRYDHDLITAGETEQWFASRGMTLDDFSRYLLQRACKDAFPDARPHESLPDDLSDLLRVCLWMTDQMPALAAELRKRVSARIETEERDEAAIAAEWQRFMQRHDLDRTSVAAWLASTRRDQAWLDESIRMEAAFAHLRQKSIDDDARSRKLASMRLSLMRVEVESLILDSETAAREAVLCVTHDGETLADVAKDSGFRADRSETWIDALPPAVAQQIQSAVDGQVIGPVATADRFEVYQVLRKLEPRLSEAAICDRIDKALADEMFDDVCARHTRNTDLLGTLPQ
jgi:hypothetical protein